MKFRLLPFCVVATLIAVTAPVHARRQNTTLPPFPPPPGTPWVPPPTLEAVRLAKQITAYARAQCGEDSGAAPDCWIKALWDATQCPPADALANKDTPANKDASAVQATVAPAQSCLAGGPGFEYDVSTIKPHKDAGGSAGGRNFNGGTTDGYRAMNTTLRSLLNSAYRIDVEIEIKGDPAWMNDTRYDLEAKFAPEVMDAMKKLSPDDGEFARRYMMRQLLKDRLNLAVHLETKDVPAYDLLVGKNGLKMKEADPDEKYSGSMRTLYSPGKVVFDALGYPMPVFAQNLEATLDCPVFDKTGLTGLYDIHLEYEPQGMNGVSPAAAISPVGTAAGSAPAGPDPSGSAPPIQNAIKTLGLQLVPSRGPMMVVVIDHVERPGAN